MHASSIRVIAGQLKGRRIPTLPGQSVRPTPARAREALFSILGTRMHGATVADLFAGTGAVGLEALSRGAARVLFVEHDPIAGAGIQRLLDHFNFSSAGRVLIHDVTLAIQNPNLVGWRPFDIIFMDPPYQFPYIHQLLFQIEDAKILAPGGIMVSEHFHKTTLPEPIGDWRQVRTARYGKTAFSFYQPQPASAEDYAP